MYSRICPGGNCPGGNCPGEFSGKGTFPDLQMYHAVKVDLLASCWPNGSTLHRRNIVLELDNQFTNLL